MTKMLNIFKSHQHFKDDINPTPGDNVPAGAAPRRSLTNANILSPVPTFSRCILDFSSQKVLPCKPLPLFPRLQGVRASKKP